MLVSNKIADLIVRIQNGSQTKLKYVFVPKTYYIINFLDCIQNLGYIKGYTISKNNRFLIKILLKYDEDHFSIIQQLRIQSKPSLRIYFSTFMIAKYIKLEMGSSVLILSTTKGIVSHFQALKLNVGGEIICKIV